MIDFSDKSEEQEEEDDETQSLVTDTDQEFDSMSSHDISAESLLFKKDKGKQNTNTVTSSDKKVKEAPRISLASSSSEHMEVLDDDSSDQTGTEKKDPEENKV